MTRLSPAAAKESLDPWAEAYTQNAASSNSSSIYSSVYGPIEEAAEAPLVAPAELDALKFTLDPAVAFWRDYSPVIVDDVAPMPEQLRWLSRVRAALPPARPPPRAASALVPTNFLGREGVVGSADLSAG